MQQKLKIQMNKRTNLHFAKFRRIAIAQVEVTFKSSIRCCFHGQVFALRAKQSICEFRHLVRVQTLAVLGKCDQPVTGRFCVLIKVKVVFLYSFAVFFVCF